MRTARAAAKLNLTLHITGKRADGYHMLESLVAFTDVADVLGVAPADVLTLQVHGPFAAACGDGTDNLVMRAAQALQRAVGITDGAAITLEKHIPIGAGLGGGSADAAACLHLLNAFWKLQLGEAALHDIAITLGADVAMCLHSRALVARGVGDLLSPLAAPLPALHAVLVYPNKALATADVYRAYRHDASRSHPAVEDYMAGRNDLQPAAIGLLAEVAQVLLALETALPKPVVARMSGSGACCFALYDSPAAAQQAQARLSTQHPDWWVRATAVY